jgi:hypothetical protein
MDALDLKILAILDSDPRRPYAETRADWTCRSRRLPIACADSRLEGSYAAQSHPDSAGRRHDKRARVRERVRA